MGQFSFIFPGLVSPLEFVLHHPGFTVSTTILQIHHCSLDKRHRYQKEIPTECYQQNDHKQADLLLCRGPFHGTEKIATPNPMAGKTGGGVE